MFFMGKTQLVPAGYVVNKNGLGGSVWVPNKIETPIYSILSRHWEKTNEAIFEKFSTLFLSKKRGLARNVITTRSGVKKMPDGVLGSQKSSSDDPFLTLFCFFGVFLIRLFVVPGQYLGGTGSPKSREPFPPFDIM